MLLLLLFTKPCFAQYPFEKYPAIKYIKIPIVDYGKPNSGYNGIAKYKNYKIVIAEKKEFDGADLTLYFKNKIVKKIIAPFVASEIVLGIDTVYIGDIDGNGLPDFKLVAYNNGSGLAGSVMHKVYLFNTGNNKFKPVTFNTFFDEPERDFNRDGKFELITRNYLSYNNHGYWVFDLFNYKDGKLANVSRKYNYPILIDFLDKETYSISKRIKRADMKKFSAKSPDYYDYKPLVK